MTNSHNIWQRWNNHIAENKRYRWLILIRTSFTNGTKFFQIESEQRHGRYQGFNVEIESSSKFQAEQFMVHSLTLPFMAAKWYPAIIVDIKLLYYDSNPARFSELTRWIKRISVHLPLGWYWLDILSDIAVVWSNIRIDINGTGYIPLRLSALKEGRGGSAFQNSSKRIEFAWFWSMSNRCRIIRLNSDRRHSINEDDLIILTGWIFLPLTNESSLIVDQKWLSFQIR